MADEPRATALLYEILAGPRGRERFRDFGTPDFLLDSITFVRYRPSSLSFLRRAGRADRSMFIKDLREFGRLSFPELQLAFQILNRLAPQQAKLRPNAPNPADEEIDLSARLGPPVEFVVNFRHVTAFPEPTEAMANFIFQEISMWGNKIPTYTPS